MKQQAQFLDCCAGLHASTNYSAACITKPAISHAPFPPNMYLLFHFTYVCVLRMYTSPELTSFTHLNRIILLSPAVFGPPNGLTYITLSLQQSFLPIVIGKVVFKPLFAIAAKPKQMLHIDWTDWHN